MSTVCTRDLEAIIGVSERLQRCAGLSEFIAAAQEELAGIIPCENAVLHHAPDAHSLIYTCFAPDRTMPAERFLQFNDIALKQHPLVTFHLQYGDADPGVIRLSEVATLTELRRLDVYNEFLRPAGIDRQMAALVPARHAAMVGCMVGRGGRDFTEHDAALLDLLRRQLGLAFDNMMLRVALIAALETQSEALDGTGRAVVLLGSGCSILWRSALAERWLSSYFPGDRGNALPETIRAWLVAHHAVRSPDDFGDEVAEELLVQGADGVLALRLLPSATARWEALLLEERPLTVPANAADDLTPRERDVLRAMAAGRSDAETSDMLGISVRTVQKHREHLYTKLGVRTRTAAVLYALRMHHGATRST
jgi:DNA-binding CsgD family transcriptional regulator